MSAPKFDKLQYIRDYYQVPAYKGMRVQIGTKQGVIMGADDCYIRVQLDGAKIAQPYHPTDGVTYLVEGVAR